MPYHESTVEAIIANKSKTKDKSRLSPAFQKKTKELCFINVVTVDLSYSFLYWDFLSRVLSFYSEPLNSTTEIRSAVLPHLVRELINFDEFAVVDMEGDNRCRYAVEEFYINRAIYEDCKDLAVSYGIQIDKIMQMKTEESDVARDLELSDIAKVEKVSLSKDTVKASNKLPYFMEQIIFHKRQAPSDTSPPDLKKGMFLAFQEYILPSTGPIYVKEASLTSTNSESFLPPTLQATSARNKGKKKPPVTKRNEHDKKHPKFPKQEQKDKRELVPQSSESVTSSESVSTKNSSAELKIEAGIEDEKQTPSQVTAHLKLKTVDTRPTPVLEASTSASSTTVPVRPRTQVALVKQAKLLKPLSNIREVNFHIQHRSSSSYLFQGKEYPFTIGKEDLHCFSLNFLRDIKRMTHLSPSTDKLPNIALGAITFHYQVAGVDLTKTIKLAELFLSGGKYFDGEDLDFKARHKILNGLQDMLTSEDKKVVSSLRHPDKSIQL
ncbi:MAG: hypothetical protein K2X39_09200, partial [Silvanigrellaceae bacterium]|nr:hypothetical protein [Silvanigrellaceae bacterium]